VGSRTRFDAMDKRKISYPSGDETQIQGQYNLRGSLSDPTELSLVCHKVHHVHPLNLLQPQHRD